MAKKKANVEKVETTPVGNKQENMAKVKTPKHTRKPLKQNLSQVC